MIYETIENSLTPIAPVFLFNAPPDFNELPVIIYQPIIAGSGSEGDDTYSGETMSFSIDLYCETYDFDLAKQVENTLKAIEFAERIPAPPIISDDVVRFHFEFQFYEFD
ncbi:hypothetical protein [Tuberibacillus calidus]|jgi:hypothetical protein|uniref:hypothetical protein n=1 Tax=Tuberibacillus calidus TaxID=340097 RepID=UPI000425A5B6|nr:hypothetical protein [Tuberibacillus calidus]